MSPRPGSTTEHKAAADIAREKEVKLIKIAIAITSLWMLVELVIGYTFSALVLVADSYHMLNDLVAFLGFARTQFVANLINGVLLLALCLTLALESMQRFYAPETMALPPVVAGLGFLALIWNVVMFWMFSSANDHRSPSHSLRHPAAYRRRAIQDAAGNIAVIVDGLISCIFGPKIGRVSGLVKPWAGVGYVDPLASLVVVYVILVHAFPLVTASSYALMQAFDPQHTKEVRRIFERQDWLPTSLRHRLRVDLVDLHIWSLGKDDHVATVKFVVCATGGSVSAHDLGVVEEAAKHVLAGIEDDGEGIDGRRIKKRKGLLVAMDRITVEVSLSARELDGPKERSDPWGHSTLRALGTAPSQRSPSIRARSSSLSR
ncbi:hypothetical protein JCM10212_006167 [Sporobolomyces blumeae]